MLDLIWLVPALPLAGFVIILLFGRLLGEPKAGYLATAMVAGSSRERLVTDIQSSSSPGVGEFRTREK